MPKSRGRRPRRNRHSSGSQHRRSPRPPGVDLAGAQVVAAVNDAEARGDAATALRIVAGNLHDDDGGTFWTSARLGRLLQLVQLGPMLPRWATSRWILEQALVQLDPTLRPGHQQALQTAIELRGGPDELRGADEFDARVKVMDHDWVYRQLMLYDHGGLRRFLDRVATPDLVAGADQVYAWAEAPLRALRLEDRARATLCWSDVATGESIVTPNLGAAVLELPGDHALARVVPTEGGPMFDGVPLGVTEATAHAVAEDPAHWLGALRAIAGTEDYFADLVHGNFLLSDVPARIAMLALVDFVPPARLRDADEQVLTRATFDLARQAAVGPTSRSPLDTWPCLAALLLELRLPLDGGGLGREDASWLGRLAELLPTPADRMCHALLADLAEAA